MHHKQITSTSKLKHATRTIYHITVKAISMYVWYGGILSILRFLTVHYHLHKSLPLVPILSHNRVKTRATSRMEGHILGLIITAQPVWSWTIIACFWWLCLLWCDIMQSGTTCWTPSSGQKSSLVFCVYNNFFFAPVPLKYLGYIPSGVNAFHNGLLTALVSSNFSI
jgi:hypothetical protein